MKNAAKWRSALVPHDDRLALRVALVIAGSIVSAYGITLAIHAGFGKATLAVLWEGISHSFEVSLGVASFLTAIAMIAFALAFDRHQIAFGTALYQITYSPCIDIFANSHFYFHSQIPDFLLMLIGIVLFAIGTGMYAAADSGKGSYEALNFTVVRLSGRSVKSTRMALDAGAVIAGVLMGGSFGACTICTILISGPAIQKSIELTRKLFRLDP